MNECRALIVFMIKFVVFKILLFEKYLPHETASPITLLAVFFFLAHFRKTINKLSNPLTLMLLPKIVLSLY